MTRETWESLVVIRHRYVFGLGGAGVVEFDVDPAVFARRHDGRFVVDLV